jgi:hypothetical protein
MLYAKQLRETEKPRKSSAKGEVWKAREQGKKEALAGRESGSPEVSLMRPQQKGLGMSSSLLHPDTQGTLQINN